LSQITRKSRQALARHELLQQQQQQQASPPSLEMNAASLNRLIANTGPQIPSSSTQQHNNNNNDNTSGKKEKKRARDAATAFLDDVGQDKLLRKIK
jgi:hypothetical protein